MTETQQNQRKGARVPSRKGFRLLGASTRPVSHFQLPGAVDAARVLGASRVPWTWLGQDLFADFVAQIIQQLLRAQAASFRLEPGPVQQRPELGKGHAVGAKCQRGATGAVGVGQGAQLPQGGPIAQLHVIGNGRSDMLGGQQVFPERGKTAVASGAALGELAFQVFAHGADDFSFGHAGRSCSSGQTETRPALAPTRQSWLTGMSASGSH